MIELLLGKAGAIGAGIIAILGVLTVMFRTAFKAGKDSQLAKEGKANLEAAQARIEMHKDADAIERSNAALADAKARERAKRIVQ